MDCRTTSGHKFRTRLGSLELIMTMKTLIFLELPETFRQIKQSTKKVVVNTISTRLLGLEFRSNMIKSKAMKLIVKKKKNCLIKETMETYCVSCKKNTANKKLKC